MSGPAADGAIAGAITGVILAGGRGSRMGGVEKGLVPLAGRPMIARVLATLRPQVDTVIINANERHEAYAALGCAVVPDRMGGRPGPLAGMAAGLDAAATDWVLFVPCDTPLLPPDLARRLGAGAAAAGADVAIARDREGRHPTCALIRRALGPSLEAFLEGEERKIMRWMGEQRLAEVDFSDCAWRFANVNTPAELEALAARIPRGGDG